MSIKQTVDAIWKNLHDIRDVFAYANFGDDRLPGLGIKFCTSPLTHLSAGFPLSYIFLASRTPELLISGVQ